ncbi:hypothetical protein WBP07_22455 (plasmid) [Novosphingobium sp. BL-8A]|uniref:hypothetical protein n=1 Tax=Novosphingobium sp. BL-8A TaxID=3127639 RepID=UPI003756598E
MTPLERMARAAFTADWAAENPQPWDQVPHETRLRYRSIAFAVLAAIREPDDGMEAAGDKWLASASCRAVWSAMLEAALTDEETKNP